MKRPSLRRQLITFYRIIRQGLYNLTRNLWLTTAAVAVMVVTLMIVITALFANLALQETIDDISQDLTISVFIRDEADPTKERALEQVLKDSREEIRKILRETEDLLHAHRRTVQFALEDLDLELREVYSDLSRNCWKLDEPCFDEALLEEILKQEKPRKKRLFPPLIGGKNEPDPNPA